MQAISFPPGIPQLVMLESLESLSIGDGYLYRATDGRFLHLEPGASDSLKPLNPKPGEPFYICRRQERNTGWYWDMWLTPQSEQLRERKEAA